jgi:hypothetical protein
VERGQSEEREIFVDIETKDEIFRLWVFPVSHKWFVRNKDIMWCRHPCSRPIVIMEPWPPTPHAALQPILLKQQ